jgi:defect in organelle trafficking protein DotA
MKKWVWPLIILLTLFCGAALADSANPVIASSAVANKTDLSIAYLSSVFGTVSGVLTGTSGQMLGKLMYQFNQGMLVVAGCWLAYSVLSIVLKTGLTGSFMSQEYKVPMVVLRIALGFGLLIPNPSTGYTVLQGIVMQVTVQGVKLADQVWEYGLDYMKNGGALWSRPVQQDGGATGAANASAIMSDSDLDKILGSTAAVSGTFPGNFGSLSMVQKIMAMEACMVRASLEMESNNSSSDSDSVSSPTSSTPLGIYEDLVNYKFEFPGGYATNRRNTSCGTVAWNSLVSKSNMDCTQTDAGGSSDNTSCGFSHLALRETIYSLLPAIKKYVCLTAGSTDQSSVCNGVESTDVDSSYMVDGMMNATLSYKNLIDPMVRSDVLASTSTMKTGGDNALNFYSQARKEGWMVAGRYYWDLLRVEDAYDLAMSKNGSYGGYIPDAQSYTAPGDPAAGGTQPSADNLTKTGLLIAATGDTGGYIAQVRDAISSYTGAAKSGNAKMASMPGFLSSFGVIKVLLAAVPIASVFSDLAELITTFGSYAGPIGLGAEPILWLHKLGLTCISLGFNIWIGFGLGIFTLISVTGWCPAANQTNNAWQASISWMQPLALGGAAALIITGFSLGFYTPLYPYMLFTFGTIGWLIAVIEAMVAAPLVALGITHPDGHDFVGKSTHAVMMLVGLFLRPVLMLIGLFASMILCQVSLSIVLYTFSGFVTDLFYLIHPITGQTTGDPILQASGKAMFDVIAEGRGSGFGMIITFVLVFPLFLGLFAMLVYTTTVTSFSLIHHLPNYVMQWIGGPQLHGENPQTMADHVKQSMSGMASKLGDAVAHTKKKKKTPAELAAEQEADDMASV